MKVLTISKHHPSRFFISGIMVLFFTSFFIFSTSPLQGKNAETFHLQSPDKRIEIAITLSDKIRYSVSHDQQPIIVDSAISLTLKPGNLLGQNPRIKKSFTRSINETLHPVVRQKSEQISNRCNELTLSFKGNYTLVFRAYDDGTAYRFLLNRGKTVTVQNEEVEFRFTQNHHIYFPREASFQTHQERAYEYILLDSITPEGFSSLPALVDITDGPKVAILEADLEDYPGMYLHGSNSPVIKGKFPGVALKEETVDLSRRGGDRNIKVLEYADYIAVTKGKRSLPWRVLVIAENDGQLLNCEIVYKLSKELQLKDTSWIKPGKVAWDWWNYNNVYNVDFKAGVNTDTYKYYIDFASKYGIEYIILDEGWYELGDLTKISKDINMDAIMAYAKEKNVGVILWVVWKTLDDQLEEVLNQFEQWGVKGIKVDFMQRDDQWMVNYYHKIAREAAKRKLTVDFHGSYTPRGLRRSYPNVLTREGVKGLENYKWKSELDPDHELTLPFIRMLAGPMDFTPGAMINAQEKSFSYCWQVPMSKGTRAHQLAMYVIYESPLQMLADTPTHYYAEPECMEFLSKVPSVWDETRVLEAKVGDYVAMARRKGNEWYIGAMTDWTPRQMEINFNFLPEGTYSIEIYQDGLNAERNGNDYKKISRTISNKETLKIELAPGGGWAARVIPQ